MYRSVMRVPKKYDGKLQRKVVHTRFLSLIIQNGDKRSETRFNRGNINLRAYNNKQILNQTAL